MDNSNNIGNKIIGASEIALGGAVAYKGITSGLRRTLGIRLEQHTTNIKNAKNIIKNGCILDPNFGGTGASRVVDLFVGESKKFVHITGVHKNFKDIIKNNEQLSEFILNNKWFNRLTNNVVFNFTRGIYRKIQGLIYTATSTIDIKPQGDIFDTYTNIIKDNFSTKSQALKTMADIITGRKAKTFYIGGTDEFFNKNFIPDVSDLALKTDKPLKVFRTKIGAIIDAIKREGLSGIKQNKTRVAFGCVVLFSAFLIAGKLIKKGIDKIKKDN